MPYKDPERQRKAQREWYERNREQHQARVIRRRNELCRLVHVEKLARGCERCGYNQSPKALDVHHPNGKNGVDERVAMLVRRGFAWEKIKAVIDDCEILCANCHRELHA